ncbi:uncharacterized protein [Amphiura filiformis]
MGICCCKPPDDDEENAEGKPIKDEDKTGSYGTVTEKQTHENLAEATTENEKLSTSPKDDDGVLEGPEAATEATPLLESPSPVPEENEKSALQTEASEAGEEAAVKDTTPTDGSDIKLEKEQELPSTDTTTGQTTMPQIEVTTSEEPSGASSQTTPKHSRGASVSENDPLPSPSEEGLQVAHDADGHKKRKSVGHKIKKKLSKLGHKRKRSSKSTSSTGGESSDHGDSGIQSGMHTL